MSCPRCGQPVPAPAGLNFCTACGYALRSPAPAQPAAPPPSPVLLGECPHCGASNAVSRSACGRCRSALGETATPAAPAPAPPQAAEAPRADPPRLLLIATLIAGVVVSSVLLTLLGARGIGIFREPTVGISPSGFARLEVAGVAVSSTRATAGDASATPENLVDGDPATAWSAQGAAGEWVELTLGRQATVSRLLVWNGAQRGAQFDENGRAHTLLIDAGGRRFSVDLLDVRDSQAIDLPEPVPTQRIRLTIDAAYEGDRSPDTALSEIEVYGPSPRG